MFHRIAAKLGSMCIASIGIEQARPLRTCVYWVSVINDGGTHEDLVKNLGCVEWSGRHNSTFKGMPADTVKP